MDRIMMMLCLLAWLLLAPAVADAGEVLVQLSTKRVNHIISKRFLSISLDPKDTASETPLGVSTLNIAKALHPMFVRLGGISTDELHFDADKNISPNATVTGDQWLSCYEFCQEAGVDLILSLNPTTRLHGVWDSKNSLEIVSFSYENQMDVVYQLGHCTRRLEGIRGAELGRDVVRLRMILDAFPGYAGSPVLAPDVDPSAPGGPRLLREFLVEAASSLAAIPIAMRPVNIDENDDLPAQGVLEVESILWTTSPITGKPIPKKPLWIAESEARGGTMDDALSWVRRLGLAAKSGYQVVLKQVPGFNVNRFTPDLWASLMFKALVGHEVFDAKVSVGDKSTISVFAHCTAPPNPNSILDPSWRYERGSITLYGVNKSPEPTRLSLRVGVKEEPMHVYTLAQDPLTKEMLFNGEHLAASREGELPWVSPRPKRASRFQSVLLPGRSIFFLVLPRAGCRACTAATSVQAAAQATSPSELVRAAIDLLRPLPTNLDQDRKRAIENPDYGITNFVRFANQPVKRRENEDQDSQGVRYITLNTDPLLGQSVEELKCERCEEDEKKDEQKVGRTKRKAGQGDQLAEETEAVSSAEEPLPTAKGKGKGRACRGTRLGMEARAALEDLTRGGERLLETIDSSFKWSKKALKRGLASWDRMDDLETEPNSSGGKSPAKGDSSDEEGVKEEAAKELTEGLGVPPFHLRASFPTENEETEKVDKLIDNVMAEVKDKLVEEREANMKETEGAGVRVTRADQSPRLSTADGSVLKTGLLPDLKVTLSADDIQEKLEEFREKLKASREKLRSMAGLPSLQESPPPLSSIGESLRAAVESVPVTLSKAETAIQESLTPPATTISESLKAALTSAPKNLAGARAALQETLPLPGNSIGESLRAALSSAPTSLAEAKAALQESLPPPVTSVGESLRAALASAPTSLAEATAALQESLPRSASSIGESLRAVLDSAPNSLAEARAALEESLPPPTTSVGESLRAALASAPTLAKAELDKLFYRTKRSPKPMDEPYFFIDLNPRTPGHISQEPHTLEVQGAALGPLWMGGWAGGEDYDDGLPWLAPSLAHFTSSLAEPPQAGRARRSPKKETQEPSHSPHSSNYLPWAHQRRRNWSTGNLVVPESAGAYKASNHPWEASSANAMDGTDGVASDFAAQAREVSLGSQAYRGPSPRIPTSQMNLLFGDDRRGLQAVPVIPPTPFFTPDSDKTAELREKVLAEGGPRDLFSTAKKFTSLDLKNQGIVPALESSKTMETIESNFGGISSTQEVNSNQEGENVSSNPEEDNDEEWLADTKRISPPRKDLERPEEKKVDSLMSIVDKIRSVVGLVFRLASHAQANPVPVPF